MPVKASGRIIKTRKVKKGSQHQKNHRWESFTTKISRLNSLDPLRKIRRHDIDVEDISTSTSYFRSGLDKWEGLNLSKVFVAFSCQVRPLCDSLPLILHHEAKIVTLLYEHIEEKECYSLEPLLELLTDFAHDLGTRFQKHYTRALQLLMSIAESSENAEVIEWTFSSLAFLFKYLSKLLVSDLRPTYSIVAPLLGKKRQPPHIARFAAEALSYLVKRAGTPAHKEIALPLIVHHAKSDLLSICGTREFGLYYHAIMTLFAEAMKGNRMGLHTSAPAILQVIFLATGDEQTEQEDNAWTGVMNGILTSILHHTNVETFNEMQEVIRMCNEGAINDFTTSRGRPELRRLMISTRFLSIAAGVRMGSRVSDWAGFIKSMLSVLGVFVRGQSTVSEFCAESLLWTEVTHGVAILLQYAPTDTISPYIAGLLGFLMKDPFAESFLTFCSYFSKVNPDRFRIMVLPHFRRFVVAHWSDGNNRDILTILLPRMIMSEVLLDRYEEEGFTLPKMWQDQIISEFEHLETKPFPEQASRDQSPHTWQTRCLPTYYALLGLLECTDVQLSTKERIAEVLNRKLKLALRPSSSLAQDEARLLVGRGFSAYARISEAASEVDMSLHPLLVAAASSYSRLPHFLEALLIYLKSHKSCLDKISTADGQSVGAPTEGRSEDVVDSLVSNLTSQSHELRLISMEILVHYQPSSESLKLMSMIEQTPLDLQSVRTVSMHLRTLALLYPKECGDPITAQAVPAFCFGMTNVKMAQISDEAILSIKQLAGSKVGEGIVAKLVSNWLEMPSLRVTLDAIKHEDQPDSNLTDFECLNLIRLDNMARVAEEQVKDARSVMLQKFKSAQCLMEPQPPLARTQALRVLAGVPQLAEKQSRQIVPMFLSWASETNDSFLNHEDGENTHSNWSRKDQKALLDLLGKFVNPKALYKAAEVYEALLNLLANGDIEVQTSALKAIFTWKDPCVRPYEENLLNLLDDSRFKDEIGILLQGETLIQLGHRQRLMPILLRLLFGRTISRKGVGSGKQGMEARRVTVIRNLAPEDIRKYLDITLGKLGTVKFGDERTVQSTLFDTEVLSVRKQVGFTRMIYDILKELGNNANTFVGTVLCAVLYCLIFSTRRLKYESSERDEVANEASQISMLRVVRQSALKSLTLLFTIAPEFDWSSSVNLIIDEIVQPRLINLPADTSQGVSSMLRMFSVWSRSHHTVQFLGRHHQIIPKLTDCLTPIATKEEVKLFVLSIFQNAVKSVHIMKGSGRAPSMQDQVFEPNMDLILTAIASVLRLKQDLSRDLLEGCLETTSDLAPLVSNSTQARSLVDVSVFLLNQPSRRVDPKAKSCLLRILEHFVPLYGLQNDAELRDCVYSTVTMLFGFFKDKPSREILSRVLLIYSRSDPALPDVAALCVELNAFVPERLDEADYDRRLKAFKEIKDSRRPSWTARQWTPILYNLLFYVKFDEQFSILSSNAADGICTFVDAASKAQSSADGPEFLATMSAILLPAIFAGSREISEAVRKEFMKVMAHVIRLFPEWPKVSDMLDLLAGDDEIESSFFNNIVTSGKSRQSSALKLLAATAKQGKFSSKNVSQFLMPLTEHFIFERNEGSDAHDLAAEASLTLAVLVDSLEWSQYRAVLRRFVGYIQTRSGMVKQVIRMLGRLIDTLASRAQKGLQDHATMAMSLPNQQKLADDLSANVLSPLLGYLHQKDESTVSLRSPVAVIVVKMLLLLPQQEFNERLPAVLTDICHILRSKAPEAREMARDTLIKICTLLGPSCFGFVLRELRGALAKGYQLHVLSYTMHSILVVTTPNHAPGDLDYCLSDIVAIIMDDIFGTVGQEKDAEEYISKMKEVKSSKSQDSMELIARTTTLGRLITLLHPLQVLLRERLDLRMVRKIDELLNRISSGLLKNSAAHSRDGLILCFEMIRTFYEHDSPVEMEKQDYKVRRYLVQKDAKRIGERATTASYTYKLMRFALDVLRSLLKKHDELRTSTNIVGLIPFLGDALLRAEEEVKIAAMKLLITIAKVPVKGGGDWMNLYRVAAVEATKNIAATSTTTADIAQVSLKLVSVILRDRKEVQVRDTAIDELLARTKDDMTEPESRHVTFNFLRAILDSKVQTAAVYDTLDFAGMIMVTNDDRDTRDLARGAYFQFLRDYPQQQTRWSKQLAFIVANLTYDRAGGRLSILEVIHLLLSKSSQAFTQEVSATCFVPLIFVLANDDTQKCRLAAGEVIKEIFRKADEERMKNFKTLLKTWLKQSENQVVVRLAYQTFGFYYESLEVSDEALVTTLIGSVQDTLRTAKTDEADWEITYAALQLTSVLTEKIPARLFKSELVDLWSAIRSCLEYPHAWVKLSAIGLIGAFFADVARNNLENGLQGLPLRGSGGLFLDTDDIIDLIRRTMGMLRTPNLSELLADEILKNLLFLARSSEANDLQWRSSSIEDDSEGEDLPSSQKKTALHYIFAGLSHHLRRDTTPPRASALIPKTASIRLLNLLANRLSPANITSNLSLILPPLHNLTDPAIHAPYSTDEVFRTNYQTLKDDAGEIIEVLKRRIGIEAYTKAFMELRKNVESRRAERSGKRKVEAITMPEKWGEEKRRKTLRKKEKMKGRASEWRAIRKGSTV